MKLVLLLVCMSLFSILSAATVVGKVTLLKGVVKLKAEGSIKKSKLKLGQNIQSGDMLMSARKAGVKLELVDGSALVLDEHSILRFTSLDMAEQLDGKVLYEITSRSAKNTLKVKTPFAIIGIKGTRFIVNASEDASISLQEGRIGVSAIEAEFELYRKKVQKEFDDYVSKQDIAFEKFKNKQDKYTIAEPTKSFDLEAGNRVSFQGLVVNEDTLDEKDKNDFDYFQQLMHDMK